MHSQFFYNRFFSHTRFAALVFIAAPFATSVLPATAQSASIGKRSVAGGSWVDLQVSTSKLRYTVGESIPVTLKATNIQEKDVYLKFTSGQRFDFKVFRLGEKEPVYVWSATKMFVMATSTVRLKLGERETYNTEIGREMGELPPGKYRLEAHLTNSSQIRARPIEFAIVPKPSVASTGDKRATLTARNRQARLPRGRRSENQLFASQQPRPKPTTFQFGSGQNYDVFIKNAAGESVWNWSANIRFIMVSRPITLAAGETQNFLVQWNGQALPDNNITPGIYTVQAVYTSNPQIFAPPVRIEIR
jgi:hypothetical protein